MFLTSKILCTYTTLSNFCKVTASLLKRLSFSDKEMSDFGQWILQNNYSDFTVLLSTLGSQNLRDIWWLWGQMTDFGTQFQPKNSYWFSVFSRSRVFVGIYLLVSFEHHQSSSTDVHCKGGSMEQYLLEDHHKPEMKS